MNISELDIEENYEIGFEEAYLRSKRNRTRPFTGRALVKQKNFTGEECGVCCEDMTEECKLVYSPCMFPKDEGCNANSTGN